MRIHGTWSLLLCSAPILLAAQIVGAQDAAPAVETAAQTASAAQASPVAAASVANEKKVKGKKAEYTGPTTVIVLPPTPMLDEEGRQRLDPDGLPMFNPAERQQRDKKGHPVFDEKGKPVFQTATDLGYDDRGKKLHAKKVKEPKMTPVSIARGTFTVDGMIGKAELNYDIADLKYIYMYAPGIGTMVVSNAPFVGAKEQKNAFDDKTLTVSVGEHKLQIASDKRILGKKPESAYVLVDREFKVPSPYPMVGYGKTLKAPYVWPGGRANEALAGAFVQPPPIPVNLRPTLLQPACPAGQMRKAAAPVSGAAGSAGETTSVQPCVSISKGKPTVSEPAPKAADAATAGTIVTSSVGKTLVDQQ